MKTVENSFYCKYAKCGQTSQKATLHKHDPGNQQDALDRFLTHIKEIHPIVWEREFNPHLKTLQSEEKAAKKNPKADF